MRWAIDVGNTETKVGRWLAGVWQVVRLSTAEVVSGASVGLPSDQPVIGVSVQPQVTALLPHVRWIDGFEPLRMASDYRARPGPDRIANALALLAFGQAAVAVDVGTATTLDIVSAEGTFLGGPILPGPLTAGRALLGRGALLPADVLDLEPGPALAQETNQALAVGIWTSHACAIEGLIARIEGELDVQLKVVLTGGLIERISRQMTREHEIRPYLTLDGVLEASRRLDDPS